LASAKVIVGCDERISEGAEAGKEGEASVRELTKIHEKVRSLLRDLEGLRDQVEDRWD